MKIFVHIIWVLPHSEIKFEGKINFENMLKIVQKLGQTLNLQDFCIIFNLFPKLIFALKFNIRMWQHHNNMHRNFHKGFITG